jgi:hypothetical protein
VGLGVALGVCAVSYERGTHVASEGGVHGVWVDKSVGELRCTGELRFLVT